ncbi:M1 family metallopeptidase [Chryseobacterium sp. MFBS3-17]|uniref:M1 family metallopeptidase n=1 Tax=Chryseobacterium sp. MFBS3-17 TaxID=2886689 RepID=UPI00293F486A|nr:M1 family metallopeptidase [Chryseobacterium sp. MFBS3-17]
MKQISDMKQWFFSALMISALGSAQEFSRVDTLKGSDTRFRDFWDVRKYEISVEPDATRRQVSGSNTIHFLIVKDTEKPVFQIDIQQPMKTRLVKADFTVLKTEREGDFLWVYAAEPMKKSDRKTLTIAYEGNPVIAKNAPWDGGWVFSEDSAGMPFVSVAQEGIGTSVWLPLKDSWSDEPDEGITMKITTPENLVGVGNGRLIQTTASAGKKHYTWEVKNPINGYSIVPNMANYVNFKDTYTGENGILDLDYWVLPENLDKARTQFKQVNAMLKALEYWFGPYPFYEDSFKVVDAPYLGMEHQSNIAYGNRYENGYLGRDISGSGVGLKWDFIIVHESGHEWFANNITAADKADMWIHEAFTSYSETLFTEQYLNKEAAEKYVQGTRHNIVNDEPIIGKYGVRYSGTGDMYYKGANMLHTIRHIIHNDQKFREILRGLNRDFRLQTVSTRQIEQYFSEKSGIDLSTVFDQYLRTTDVPVLEYQQNGKTLKFRYRNTVKDLKMPLRINGTQVIHPAAEWQKVRLKNALDVQFDPNYFVEYRKV